MIEKLSKKKLLDEAKKCFKKLEKRKPIEGNIADMRMLSVIQLGIKHGYQMGYDEYYMPLCDKCNFNRATCFGPGAFCDECSMEEAEDEEE